jgi:hypothetical protein
MKLDQLDEKKIKALFPGIEGVSITGVYHPRPDGDDADYRPDELRELWIEVAVEEHRVIELSLERMKQLSEILGTEHLNFFHHNGDHLADSVTWDGCNVLRVIAWWGDRERSPEA